MNSTINLPIDLSSLDWLVFTAILVLTFLAMYFGHRLKKKDLSQEENTLELLLMGRRLTLPLFVATLVSTWYGGIFGVTEIAYEKGVFNFLTQGVFWYVTYLIFAFFLVHKIRSTNAYTLPHLVKIVWGPKASKLAAIFNFFNVLPISYTLSLGLFIELLTPLNFTESTGLGLGIVLLYAWFGGFRAVVFSDLVQFAVMFIGVFCITVVSLSTFGGWDYLVAHLPASHFDPMGGYSPSHVLVWGFIALSTLVDPNFYQRVLAAKDEATARRGIFFATGLWLLFDLMTTSGGLFARAAMPDLDPSSSYLVFALEILPYGFKGLFLASILAILLSTLDSYLFLAATTCSHDLLPKKFHHHHTYHRLLLLLVALLCFFLAHQFTGGIRQVWRFFGSLSAASLLFPMGLQLLGGLKITEREFVAMCLVGATGTFVPHLMTTEWDGLYWGCGLSALALLCLRIIKLFFHTKG